MNDIVVFENIGEIVKTVIAMLPAIVSTLVVMIVKGSIKSLSKIAEEKLHKTEEHAAKAEDKVGEYKKIIEQQASELEEYKKLVKKCCDRINPDL